MPKLRCHRRFTRYSKLLLGVGLYVVLLSNTALLAQDSPHKPQQLTAQEQAKHSIPWDKLTDTAKTKLRTVISDTTVFHRLKTQQFKCDESVYIHLVRHPEILTNIWELMGVTQLRIERTAPFSISIHDGQYTKTTLELVYGTSNLHVFHCEGSYKGMIIPTVSTGRAIIIIRSKYDNAEVPTVKHQMDIFLQIDNAANQLLVKTLSYFFMKTAGESYVTQVESYQVNMNSVIGNYQDNRGARLEKRARIDILDLKEQDPGDMHMFFKSKIQIIR